MSNGPRKITVGQKTYVWKVGKSNVVIRSPEGKSTVVNLSTILGKSWDIIERGQYKGTDDGTVMPKHVRIYIEVNSL